MAGLLADYLATLPDGMRSYPRALVKGNVLDETLAWLEEIGAPPDPALVGAIRSARPLGHTAEWVPDVLVNALSLQIADVAFPSGAAWLDAVYRRQRAVYATPVYRALMLVLSPTLLTMGAKDRWAAYRRGSELVVDRWNKAEAGRRVTTGTLRHPPGLYAELHIRGFAHAILAAVDACGARDSTMELLSESEPGAARFRVTYRA